MPVVRKLLEHAEQTKQRFLVGTPWKEAGLDDVQVELFESQFSTPLFDGMR